MSNFAQFLVGQISILFHAIGVPAKSAQQGTVRGHKRVADRFCSQRNNMHGVIRKYSGKGATDFFNLLEKRKSEVENAFRPVKGFVSYTLVHCGEGGFSVTICQDKAGADESVRVAKDWIVNNAENTGVGAPQVSEGSVIIHMDSH